MLAHLVLAISHLLEPILRLRPTESQIEIEWILCCMCVWNLLSCAIDFGTSVCVFGSLVICWESLNMRVKRFPDFGADRGGILDGFYRSNKDRWGLGLSWITKSCIALHNNLKGVNQSEQEGCTTISAAAVVAVAVAVTRLACLPLPISASWRHRCVVTGVTAAIPTATRDSGPCVLERMVWRARVSVICCVM